MAELVETMELMMVETDKFMKDYPLPSSDVKPFTDEVPVLPTVPYLLSFIIAIFTTKYISESN